MERYLGKKQQGFSRLRTIIRYSQKIKELGVFGVKHGNYGKTSNSIKYPIELREKVLELYVGQYYDFNLKHFSEI